MKKLIATLMALAMMVTLVACGGNDKPAEGNTSNPPASSQKDETPASSAAEAETSGDADAEMKLVTAGKLTMATNAAFPPYEFYEGGNIVGIDAEIAGAVAEKLGLELVIEDMEFNSIIGAVQSGRADIGFAGMTVNEDRLKNVDFTTSYATGVQVVIVAADSDIKSLDDLEGKMIGVQLSTTGDLYACDEFGAEHVDQYNKGAEAVNALLTGKVDCVIIDNEPAKNFVASNEGKLAILDTEYAVEDYAACIAKTNPALTEAVNKAMAELTADGTIPGIIEKYIPSDNAQ